MKHWVNEHRMCRARYIPAARMQQARSCVKLRLRRSAYIASVGSAEFRIPARDVAAYGAAVPVRRRQEVASSAEHEDVANNAERYAVGAWLCDNAYFREADAVLQDIVPKWERTYARASPDVLRVARVMANEMLVPRDLEYLMGPSPEEKADAERKATPYLRFAFAGLSDAPREYGKDALFYVYYTYAKVLMFSPCADAQRELGRVIDKMQRVVADAGAADAIPELEAQRHTFALCCSVVACERRCGARFGGIGIDQGSATSFVLASMILKGEFSQHVSSLLGGIAAAERRVRDAQLRALSEYQMPCSPGTETLRTFIVWWFDLVLTYCSVLSDASAVSTTRLQSVIRNSVQHVIALEAADPRLRAAGALLGSLMDVPSMVANLLIAYERRRRHT